MTTQQIPQPVAESLADIKEDLDLLTFYTAVITFAASAPQHNEIEQRFASIREFAGDARKVIEGLRNKVI
jgi:hypothetical protein